MSDDVLERLARLEAEATAGPWAADPEFDPERPAIYTGLERIAELDSWDRGGEDAQAIAARDAVFIAALRNAAPVLLAIARTSDVLSGYARHENDCHRTLALMRGEGLSQGGPGASCNCGFKDAMDAFESALSRLDEVNLP